MGTVPENYLAKECNEASFSPGDYEVIMWTDRFEVRRRMHVESDGQIDILNWDDLSENECEAALKMRIP